MQATSAHADNAAELSLALHECWQRANDTLIEVAAGRACFAQLVAVLREVSELTARALDDAEHE